MLRFSIEPENVEIESPFFDPIRRYRESITYLDKIKDWRPVPDVMIPPGESREPLIRADFEVGKLQFQGSEMEIWVIKRTPKAEATVGDTETTYKMSLGVVGEDLPGVDWSPSMSADAVDEAIRSVDFRYNQPVGAEHRFKKLAQLLDPLEAGSDQGGPWLEGDFRLFEEFADAENNLVIEEELRDVGVLREDTRVVVFEDVLRIYFQDEVEAMDFVRDFTEYRESKGLVRDDAFYVEQAKSTLREYGYGIRELGGDKWFVSNEADNVSWEFSVDELVEFADEVRESGRGDVVHEMHKVDRGVLFDALITAWEKKDWDEFERLQSVLKIKSRSHVIQRLKGIVRLANKMSARITKNK